WTKPICIGRHAFGDQYKATDAVIKGPGELKMFPKEAVNHRFGGLQLHRCKRGSFVNVQYRRDSRIYSKKFTKATGNQSLRLLGYGMNTVSLMIWLFKSDEGYVWACKNYDGDVQSNMLAQGFGSLGLMTSVLVCPDGKTIEAEAAPWHFDTSLWGAPKGCRLFRELLMCTLVQTLLSNDVAKTRVLMIKPSRLGIVRFDGCCEEGMIGIDLGLMFEGCDGVMMWLSQTQLSLTGSTRSTKTIKDLEVISHFGLKGKPPTPIEDVHEKKRGDTKDHPLDQYYALRQLNNLPLSPKKRSQPPTLDSVSNCIGGKLSYHLMKEGAKHGATKKGGQKVKSKISFTTKSDSSMSTGASSDGNGASSKEKGDGIESAFEQCILNVA
ncbi:isocitrate dehydrogenase [NADP], partial [Tanacetum coccineum]